MNIKWIGAAYYNSGRGGYSVKQIVPHISESPTLSGVDATFTNGAREASAHYCVGGSEIHQYVSEGDTAWAVGNWVGNRETISIEHVGTTGNPPSRETLETSAELHADIARRYGWSQLVLGVNVGLHKWYSATSCPATLDYNYIINRANEILRGDIGWNGPGTELAGSSRAETAGIIADAKGRQASFMLTSGYNWPDSCSGMWAAGHLDANILYGDDSYYLTDGSGGIRLGSDNRFGTNRYSLEFWNEVKGLPLGDECLVVPGLGNGIDAAISAWVSYRFKKPIILFEDHKNFYYLISKFKTVTTIGGSVPDFKGMTRRIAGADRYATAVAVAEEFAETWGQPMFVNPDSYADAIAAAQWVGNDCVLLAGGQATLDAVAKHSGEITDAYWIGDKNSIDYDTRHSIAKKAGLE